MRRFSRSLRPVAAALPALALAGPAEAYIGPGAGIGAVVLTIALALAVLLLVVGFLWYPLKRLLKGRRKARDQAAPDDTP